MKKSVFLAVFGMVFVVVSSSGQGYIEFNSYLANGDVGAPAYFFYVGGKLVGIPFEASLYYALGTVSDPVDFNSYESMISPVSSAFTLLSGVSAAYDNSGYATGAAGLGYFDGPTVVIPGYTSGPISFEVVAFEGSSYDDAQWRGRSGAFTESYIANNASAPVTFFGDYGPGLPNIILPGPEPTTLALAGLGGLVSLVMFRRKQS